MSVKRLGLIGRIQAVFSNRFDDYMQSFLTGEDHASPGINVDENTSMKYSTLFACFRVLAETFASVPVFEYKKLPNGDREQTNDTGIYDILHGQANEDMSSYNLKEALMYQLCAGGNAIAQREYNSYGGLSGLYPYVWQQVRFDRDRDTNRLIYKIRTGSATEEITKKRSDLLHVPGPSMNGVMGMSIIEFATSAIRLGITYERFGQKFYENGAMPSGIFKHPGFLKDDAYARLKKDLAERYQGMTNSGRPILAEDGLDFKELTIKPIDAQLIECKKLQSEDICRFCRVPLHLVQNLDKATNNNIEHQSLEFVMYTMLPHFKRFEEAFNTQLLSSNQRKDGYYLEFNISSLLRGDAKSMAEAFAVGRQWGWLSVNDIRRLMNMNSISNGDIYLTPLNMIEAGKEPPEPKQAAKQEKPDVSEKVLKEIDDIIRESRI
jgi:HK97 family phage portal protein